VDDFVFALKIATATAMKEVFESVVLGRGGGPWVTARGGRKVGSLFRRWIGSDGIFFQVELES